MLTKHESLRQLRPCAHTIIKPSYAHTLGEPWGVDPWEIESLVLLYRLDEAAYSANGVKTPGVCAAELAERIAVHLKLRWASSSNCLAARLNAACDAIEQWLKDHGEEAGAPS